MQNSNIHQTKESFIEKVKETFPYVNDLYNGPFTYVQIGSSDSKYMLLRIHFELDREKKIKKVLASCVYEQYGFGDGTNIVNCTHSLNELKTKIINIIKINDDKDKEQTNNILKSDLRAMMLSGFLTRNGLTYTCNKVAVLIDINIFGTIFDNLTITIPYNKPDSYIIQQGPGLNKTYFNQEQLEKYILMCKELKGVNK